VILLDNRIAGFCVFFVLWCACGSLVVFGILWFCGFVVLVVCGFCGYLRNLVLGGVRGFGWFWLFGRFALWLGRFVCFVSFVNFM